MKNFEMKVIVIYPKREEDKIALEKKYSEAVGEYIMNNLNKDEIFKIINYLSKNKQ